MTTIGIVAEWNPFHNGHQRLVHQIRADRPEVVIISVMSGAFCQRGEVSCFDKWLRAEMALAAGVDVVLELPQVYATASLEGFARGGVATLLAFAPLDGLYCGSESGDLAALTAQTDYLRAHQKEFDLAMRTAGENGMNYAQASQEFLRAAGFCSDKNTPNDRLALWYRMSLPREIPMQLVQRSVAHDASEAAAQTMSASAIRSHLPDRLNDIADYLPQTSLAIMRRALANDWRPANEEKLLTALQVLCAALEPEGLAKRLTIRDGWAPRLLAAVRAAESYDDLITRAQTRHYSRSRVRRLLLALLSPLPPAPASPPFVRLLGASPRGRALLKNRTNGVPLIVNVGRDQYQLVPEDRALLLADIHRQTLADILCEKRSARDYYEPPRFIRS